MNKSYNCRKTIILLIVIIFITVVTSGVFSKTKWKIHDTTRPVSPVITPGTAGSQDTPGQPPSDAIVLFDGRDLFQWRSMDGSPAKWIVNNGCMECVKGSGYIRTARNFGNCQLHIEFATPTPPQGTGQGRGNSGVFLMGKYEVQVLDSYENKTYTDGQCSAIYGQYPPQVNVCRKPGEWQSYDIIFHAPVFNDKKELVKQADMTVFQNGVLTQDHVKLTGPTNWTRQDPYTYHPEKMPLSLQDHGNPVLYRNIWIRELPAPRNSEHAPRPEYTLSMNTLKQFPGLYEYGSDSFLNIKMEDNELLAAVGSNDFHPIYAESDTKFFSKHVDLELEFKVSGDTVTGVDFFIAGGKIEAKKVK
ncbi:DUF1080 domain-containing protein [candidate division KSB1 bacterium]|nr:DUF1080 domain-containing protein [candidate division KSB1 bacterium]